MEFLWFCCIAGNFLCICWRILNVKIFIFILKFIAWYLSFTCTVKTRLPIQTKKCHIYRKYSISTTFYNSQRIRKFAFLGKIPPELAYPFLGLVPQNLTMRELVYDKLFILCWRIYLTVRDFNYTLSKFFIVPYFTLLYLSMTSTRLWMTRQTLYF
jgi:hypothetical protein